ncbi:MAG TPA: glycosyltransferase [Candidatus Gastranaerophilaceae bacterium]|nr:glycosyltransferase [Candidatus Gastranaerophilaceae bacterium]HPT41251.1 glycosyltransferase [Candidatus Gastranaerophilaceae bacterium]
MNPKISIIVPVYNNEKFLSECLDSICRQTFSDIEIICINDGSTDNSLSILEEYALKDKRIILLNQENKGLGYTMNRGIKTASGDFIGIVESDDYILENMYESLYKIAVKNDADFVKSNFCVFYDEENSRKFIQVPLFDDEKYYNIVLNPKKSPNVFNAIMNNWTGIYKKDFLEKNKIYHLETPGASFQDTGFWFKAFCCAERIFFLDKEFYMCRRDNPDSSVNSKEKVFCICEEYSEIENFLNSRPDLKKYFEKIKNHKKFQMYQWNFTRMGSKYKQMFIKNASKEFKLAQKKGMLDKNLFGAGEWKKVQFLIKHPVLFPLKYNLLSPYTKKRKELKIHFKKYFDCVRAQKQINKLARKYKNKKIVLYGAGIYCKTLFENYDLSNLNIVAVADRGFKNEENKNFFNLNCILPKDLKEFDCDLILLGVYDTLQIFDYLQDQLLVGSKNSQIKILPIVEDTVISRIKNFFS